jgi:predicted nucleotidyltransferase
MELSPKIVREIIRRIRLVESPERIILFGSAAIGTMGRHSDIDLLILKNSIAQPFNESVPFYDALAGLGFPVDVVLMETERFEESKNIIGGIAYPAHKYGKVLYAKA